MLQRTGRVLVKDLNLQEFLSCEYEMYSDIFYRLWDAVSRKRLEKLASLSRKCSSTPVGFGQGFLSRRQCNNTVASSTLSWNGCSWFLCFLEWNQHGRDCAFVILMTSLRMWRKNWKGSHRRNVCNIFVVPGTYVLLHKEGLFWRKYSLNDCTVLCSSETKWFPGNCHLTHEGSSTFWNILFQKIPKSCYNQKILYIYISYIYIYIYIQIKMLFRKN